MSFNPLGAAFELGKTAIERIWPDPIKRAEELRKLEELHQAGDLATMNAHVQLMLGQIDVNRAEAQHKSLLVAGWRPAVGWVGAVSLALIYWPKAIALTAIWVWQCSVVLGSGADPSMMRLPEFPDLGVSDLIGLLMSMLGIGALRSFEKINHVDTAKVGSSGQRR